MKLMTKSIEKILSKYPIYSQDGKGNDAKVHCKFFVPGSGWSWYVTEGTRMKDGDWEFYGLVVNSYGEKELGYFTLGQLQETFNMKVRINGRIMTMPMKIERDMCFKPTTLKDVA